MAALYAQHCAGGTSHGVAFDLRPHSHGLSLTPLCPPLLPPPHPPHALTGAAAQAVGLEEKPLSTKVKEDVKSLGDEISTTSKQAARAPGH